MNSRISIFLIFTLLAGCGVKSAPVPPPGTELPSYIDRFLMEDLHRNVELNDETEEEN